MDHEILTELQHGPKTLEEICFRVHINQYEALHLLQQVNDSALKDGACIQAPPQFRVSRKTRGFGFIA